MSALVTTRIRDAATRLHLTNLGENLEPLVARAESSTMGYLAFLAVSMLPGGARGPEGALRVGRICVVADRGLISEANVSVVEGYGFDHVLATRLHRDPTCAEAVERSSRRDAEWVPVPAARSAACDAELADGRRAVVMGSFERWERLATHRRAGGEHEAKLLALERRVRDGELVDPAKIGRAAQRILGASPVARLFDVEIAKGRLLDHYDEGAFAYEELLVGGDVLVTSLSRTEASTARVVESYRQLVEIERRFRVLKGLPASPAGPALYRAPGAGTCGVCVYVTVVEALIAAALRDADVRDPTWTTSRSAPSGRCGSWAGSGPSPSTPPAGRSASPPATTPCSPGSSPPSGCTPATGNAPRIR